LVLVVLEGLKECQVLQEPLDSGGHWGQREMLDQLDLQDLLVDLVVDPP